MGNPEYTWLSSSTYWSTLAIVAAATPQDLHVVKWNCEI